MIVLRPTDQLPVLIHAARVFKRLLSNAIHSSADTEDGDQSVRLNQGHRLHSISVIQSEFNHESGVIIRRRAEDSVGTFVRLVITFSFCAYCFALQLPIAIC